MFSFILIVLAYSVGFAMLLLKELALLIWDSIMLVVEFVKEHFGW